MIQNYVADHSTDAPNQVFVAITDSGVIASSDVSCISFSVGGNLSPGRKTFGSEQLFSVFGADDHVYSYSLGFDAAIDTTGYIFAAIQYIGATGNAIRTFYVPLSGFTGSYVTQGSFSVPSGYSLGARSMKVTLGINLRLATQADTRMTADLRYVVPRKLLQYGK